MNEHHVEGYVKIRDLLDYCENQKDHSICPNDFMRMNHSYFSDKYPKWISVEDRLPELPDRDYAFTTVIATVIGKSNTPCTVPLEYERILVKGKRIERWKFIYGRICRDTITHWQELPAPVKKDVRTDEA